MSLNVAKCNLGKVKLQANAVSGLLLKRTWSEGCPQGPFAYLVTYVASHAGIFELIFADLLLSESLQILAPCPSLPFSAVVSIRSGEYFPLNSFSVMVSVGGCMQGWFPLAGLPPCYAWGVQAPVQPLRHQFPSSSIGNEFNEPLPNQSTWSVTVVINSYSLSFENKEGGEGGLHNILGEIVREGGLMEDLRY